MDRPRALERTVLRLQGQGLDYEEIGRRLGRGAAHVERIASYALISRTRSGRPAGLRPLERRVLRHRAEGRTYEDLSRMFKRSPDHMRRVEGLAHLRQGFELLR